MIDNQKIAYDLAMIYAKIKFKALNDTHLIGDLHRHNEPEAELKILASFFNDAYAYLVSRNISEITDSDL